MHAKITHNNKIYAVDLSKPIDISIPLRQDKNPTAWYLEGPKFEPVTDGEWVGKVSEGGDVNFTTITFNPHSHGTHTESAGHITEKVYSINKQLTQFFFIAEVITVIPEPLDNEDDDFILKDRQFARLLRDKSPEALVVRTLPNAREKKTMDWSHTNWPYVEDKAMARFCRNGIKHLLIDLPSVDKEKDGGELKSHHAFWNIPKNIRLDATITEMIYVPHDVPDGTYLLNLQIASFENDATPSKPVLYAIE
ncbi:cyclase family protein [Dokdonia sp. Hel_I_53]|uniref:cyclase family protein n=1 Tax=Dokdonia sp. Hel_I_53 TaxID=1566287 RepID=UPI0011A69D4E|nr:cyclase family protein [Dokdonia sp. Hel_I_53]